MKKLSVLGEKVSVKVKKCTIDGHAAEYHQDLKLILIDPRYDFKFQSLIHELTHAAWHRSGLGQARISGEIEEVLCEVMANVISDNIVILYQMHNQLKKIEKK